MPVHFLKTTMWRLNKWLAVGNFFQNCCLIACRNMENHPLNPKKWPKITIPHFTPSAVWVRQHTPNSTGTQLKSASDSVTRKGYVNFPRLLCMSKPAIVKICRSSVKLAIRQLWFVNFYTISTSYICPSGQVILPSNRVKDLGVHLISDGKPK